MRNVLADLAVESEAATHLMLRLAGAFDRRDDEHEAALARIATPVGKYWVTKRTAATVGEALECLGGNGYVEESIMPRLFRESPLNSIWEGSGNVIALDVLRAMVREPGSLHAFMSEIEQARGGDARLDAAFDMLADRLAGLDDPEWNARRVVESMALTLQGSLLVRFGHHAVADAFCATRLGADRGHTFGTLPGGLAIEPILARAGPHP
jgi:putative acyl-CoA dehydrogenase